MFFIKFVWFSCFFKCFFPSSEWLSFHIFSFSLFITPDIFAESGTLQMVSYCTCVVQSISYGRFPKLYLGFFFCTFPSNSMFLPTDFQYFICPNLWSLTSTHCYHCVLYDLQLPVLLLENCPQAENWAKINSPCEFPFSQDHGCLLPVGQIDNSCFECVV